MGKRVRGDRRSKRVIQDRFFFLRSDSKCLIWVSQNFRLLFNPIFFLDILPKPVISAFPPVRGQELQIRCKGWLAGMGFALYKEGLQEPVQQLGAIGREAFFTIQRMENKDEGNYSCRSHTEKRPFK